MGRTGKYSGNINMKSILFVPSAPYFISALCAFKTLYSESSKQKCDLLIYYPADDGVINRSYLVIKSFAQKFSCIDRHFVFFKKDLNVLTAHTSLKKTIETFISYLGNNEYDDLFFPHQSLGNFYPLLCLSYPNARRVEHGDGFGLLYTAKEIKTRLNTKYDPKKSLQQVYSLMKSTLYQSFINKTSKRWHSKLSHTFLPDILVPILPIDSSGNKTDNIALKICLRETFATTVAMCREGTLELNQYIEKLVAAYEQKTKYVLIAELFSEARMCSVENEIEFNAMIIKKYCDLGSVIFIKEHPSSTFSRYEKLKEIIPNQFEIVPIDNTFSAYPIELWKTLVERSTVLAAGWAILTLRYLYKTPTIYIMTDELVEQWFDCKSWNWMKNANQLFVGARNNLDSWDNNSVLWSGKDRLSNNKDYKCKKKYW
jgi:hypothetical protein